MSVAFNDRSTNTVRSDRDLIQTGTTALVDNFYKAKSLWVEADPEGNPGVFTPPVDGTVTTWTEE